MAGATTPTPTFKPRGPGIYRFTLAVHDGTAASAPDSVQVTLVSPPPHGGDDDPDRGDHNDDGDDH